MQLLGFVLLGLVAGVFAGLLGIGGGLVIVPALIFIFNFKELEALGTSLASLIPPVGLLGAWEYYRRGHIQIPAAAGIALGLFLGALVGARVAFAMPPELVRRVYAVFLVGVAVRMWFGGR